MGNFMAQLRQVLRRLGRTPMFTAVTLITLAAGVGANTVVFSVLEGILLKPLPYPHSEQLVGISHAAPGIGITSLPGAPSNYFIYRDQNQTFQEVAMSAPDSASVTGMAEPEQVRVERVTDRWLPTLGVQPVLGRGFSRQDDLPGNPETVVLMYAYWQRKFGGNANVLGQALKIDGKAHQIIGVMPKDFRLVNEDQPALLIPFQFDRNKFQLSHDCPAQAGSHHRTSQFRRSAHAANRGPQLRCAAGFQLEDV
jgi:hypothetical protein